MTRLDLGALVIGAQGAPVVVVAVVVPGVGLGTATAVMSELLGQRRVSMPLPESAFLEVEHGASVDASRSVARAAG